MASPLADLGRTARDSGWLWAFATAVDHVAPISTRAWWPARFVTAGDLETQVSAIFAAWGMPDDHRATVVERMLYADRRGIDTHGSAMLPAYYRDWRAGTLNPAPVVTVVRETTAMALVDGGGGLGHVPASTAMTLAIEKARATGVAAVAVRRSGHFGAAGAYAALAADAGCLGIVTSSTPTAIVAPTFGVDPKLGTNPLAIAAPAGRHRSFLLDMATSTVSLGVLADRWRAHGRVPDGWAIDAQGRAISNGARALRHGRLTPLGGDRDHGSHKGYGLGVAVEILSALLPGLAPRAGASRRAEVGHWMLAIDPSRFRADDGFRGDLDALIDDLHGTTPANLHQPVLVAGDPEAQMLARRDAEGIPLSRAAWEDLRRVARGTGVAFSLTARR